MDKFEIAMTCLLSFLVGVWAGIEIEHRLLHKSDVIAPIKIQPDHDGSYCDEFGDCIITD